MSLYIEFSDLSNHSKWSFLLAFPCSDHSKKHHIHTPPKVLFHETFSKKPFKWRLNDLQVSITAPCPNSQHKKGIYFWVKSTFQIQNLSFIKTNNLYGDASMKPKLDKSPTAHCRLASFNLFFFLMANCLHLVFWISSHDYHSVFLSNVTDCIYWIVSETDSYCTEVCGKHSNYRYFPPNPPL